MTDTIGGLLSDVGSAIGSGASYIGNAIGSGASAVGNAVSDIGSGIGSAAEGAYSSISSGLGSLFGSGSNAGSLGAASAAGGYGGAPLTQASSALGATAPAGGSLGVAPGGSIDLAGVQAAAGSGAPTIGAASDPLQQELTAAGINATGSNAASQAGIDSIVGGGAGAGSGIGSGAAAAAGGALPWLKNNANWLLPGAALGFTALKGTGSIPQLGQLQSEAGQLGKQGKEFMSSLKTGILPAGAQAAIDQATNAAKASVRSQYAAMGLSNSTMETQALNSIDLQASQKQFEIAQQLTETGIKETGLANQIYTQIMNAQLSQDNALQQAIANFAMSAGGGHGGININLPTGSTAAPA